MLRAVTAALCIVGSTMVASTTRPLDIFFIDVEGGASTLIVTPAGQSLLIDAGYGGGRGGREGRDAGRILAAAADAGITRIDYLLVTHFHNDHVGGVPELAARIPIGTFIDYGEPLGTPWGADRMTSRAFQNYAPVREGKPHIVPRAGDVLPIAGVQATVVSAAGTLLETPLAGGGQANDACAGAEDHPEDGTENFRSVGVMIQLGSFRFLDLGDLSGNTLTRMVCPRNLLGTATVYLVSHHGDYDTSVPALYAALRPQAAVMNNGATKGGSPDAFKALHAAPGLEDLWQLHASRNPRVVNAPDERIANLDDDGTTGYSLRLTAFPDGSYRIVNSRTGLGKTYSARNPGR